MIALLSIKFIAPASKKNAEPARGVTAWSGKRENIRAAQQAFAHRARMNGLATLGQWKADLEKRAA